MTGVRDGYFRAPLGRMLVTAAAILVVGGCAAAAPPPAPDPTPTPVAVPAGGVSMAQLGFRNVPAASITLPAGVQILRQVDQENVLTATFAAPSPAELAGWLRTSLPQAGFRITADRGDSLVFTGPGWSGAFTADNGVSALTIRRNP